ncbi:MAG: type II secretion system protein N [Gammaproteobacteria bacterium]
MNKSPGFAFLLLALCGVLVLVNGAEWLYLKRGINRSKRVVEQPVESSIVFDRIDAREFVLPPKENFNEIVERPLMIQGRRPVPETKDTPIIQQPVRRPGEEIKIKLMGVVMTPKGTSALLQDAKGVYRRVEIEGTIDGWQLAELHEDRVVLEQGGEHEELKLRKPKPKNPIPTAVQKTPPKPKPGVPGTAAKPQTLRQRNIPKPIGGT